MKDTLNEMAYIRADAIDRCYNLGKLFVAHFNEICDDRSETTIKHHSAEMQAWLNIVLSIVLKHNNKKLNTKQIYDWFITCGSIPINLFNGDENKAILYDDFANDLLDGDKNVLKSLKHVGFLTESLNEAAANSNGIYSLTKGWLKEPVKDNIPDNINLEPELTEWKDRIVDCETIEDIDNYVDELYKLRQEGLLKDGEYSKENLIFKEIRNLGLLQELKDKRLELENKELSLESMNEEDEIDYLTKSIEARRPKYKGMNRLRYARHAMSYEGEGSPWYVDLYDHFKAFEEGLAELGFVAEEYQVWGKRGYGADEVKHESQCFTNKDKHMYVKIEKHLRYEAEASIYKDNKLLYHMRLHNSADFLKVYDEVVELLK